MLLQPKLDISEYKIIPGVLIPFIFVYYAAKTENNYYEFKNGKLRKITDENLLKEIEEIDNTN
jgi:hypothetical protein